MTSLINLPFDIFKLIFSYRNKLIRWSIEKIQATWRCYRIRVLVGRFKLLYYVHVFRRFNPDLIVFLERSRL